MPVTSERYLERIGLEPPVPVSAAGLRRLQRAHLYTVPFENLDIQRKVPIVLDEEALVEKIVARRRGGFCYELNGAFCWLLRELGFAVERLSANVHGTSGWGIDFDHMLLGVDLERRWLADVGFGDNFVDPLIWEEETVQPQEIGSFRLDRARPHFILQRSNDGGVSYARQYRFEDRPYELAEFEPGCTFHQSPASHFTTRGPVCSLARLGGRLTLRADRLIETANGVRTETPIADPAEWRAALRERFGVELDPAASTLPGQSGGASTDSPDHRS